MPSPRNVLVCVILAGAFTSPVIAGNILTNSDFAGPEVGNLGDTTRTPITVDAPNTWWLGGHDSGSDDWDIAGSGATAVASNDDGAEGQGLLQWLNDGKASRRAGLFQFDFRMLAGSSGDYDLLLYVFGWNAGDTPPTVDYENGAVQTGDSFIPNGSTTLFKGPTGSEGVLVIANDGSVVYPGAVNDGVFHQLSAPVDFGTGYDFIGVLFYGENGSSSGIMELDNIELVLTPEPATAGLALIGLVAVAARRRRHLIG